MLVSDKSAFLCSFHFHLELKFNCLLHISSVLMSTIFSPPSTKKAKKGYGFKYLCVNSGGGMPQCPKKGYELDFSELVTEW